MEFFEALAGRIGEMIGATLAIGVYALMAYGLYLGLFH